MLIKRKSPFSGEDNEREIEVTEVQMELWQSGMCIQNAMPHLSADDREFLMTGITSEEWDETFKEPSSIDKEPSDHGKDVS